MHNNENKRGFVGRRKELMGELLVPRSLDRFKRWEVYGGLRKAVNQVFGVDGLLQATSKGPQIIFSEPASSAGAESPGSIFFESGGPSSSPIPKYGEIVAISAMLTVTSSKSAEYRRHVRLTQA